MAIVLSLTHCGEDNIGGYSVLNNNEKNSITYIQHVQEILKCWCKWEKNPSEGYTMICLIENDCEMTTHKATIEQAAGIA